MNAEEYLNQAVCLDQLINFNLREKERLRDLLFRVSAPDPGRDRVQTSGDGEASFARIINRITDLEIEINDEVDRLVALREQMRDVIGRLHDNEAEMILYYHYLEGKGWEEIGRIMHIDRSTASRRHARALERIILPPNVIEI